MKNPSEKLNRIFNNPVLKIFIPFVNTLITYIKQKKITKTKYDCKNDIWTIKEKNIFLVFDSRPYWNLTYDRMEKQICQTSCKFYLPKTGDVVVDVGAGVGTEIIVFTNTVGKGGRIYAIEAHPRTFSLLNMLINKNHLQNVDAFNFAVIDQIGTLCIDDLVDHEKNRVSDSDKEQLNKIAIPSTTLDVFCEENKINHIDFLRMNIEGAEFDALAGMQKTIKITKNIAVSCHDFLCDSKDRKIFEAYKKFLQNNNFVVYTVNTGHPVRDSWIYGQKLRMIGGMSS